MAADYQVYDIEQLTEVLAGNPNGFLVYKDVSTQKTYRIKISNLLGGQTSGYSWSAATTYIIGNIVESGGKWWKSLQNGNINHLPSENAYWTEVAPANESAIKAFQANTVYKSDIVVVLQAGALYSLKTGAGRPYSAASFVSADWDSIAWQVSGTTLLTGAATIRSSAANQHLFDGTWVATANNQYHSNFSGSHTLRGTASDILDSYKFTPTIIAGANNQEMNAVTIAPTFTNGGFTGLQNNGLKVVGNVKLATASIAAGTGSQASSPGQSFQTSLWNGSAPTPGWSTWRDDASTATNLFHSLGLYMNTGTSPGFSTRVFSIDSDGRVSIGVPNVIVANLSLQIRGLTASTGTGRTIYIEDSTGNGVFSLYDNGSVIINGTTINPYYKLLSSSGITGKLQVLDSGFGGTTFGSETNHSFGILVNNTVIANFSTGGYFGLGFNSAASARLHVKGSGTTGSTTTFKLTDSGNTSLAYVLDSGDWTLGKSPSSLGYASSIFYFTTANADLSIDQATGSLTKLYSSAGIAITITAGAGSGANTGKNLSLVAGAGGTGTQAGGNVVLTSGAPTGGGAEGLVQIQSRATGKIAFFNGAGAVQQTSGANLTNNVTSGGTNDQIDNWTSLTTYSTDAAAIRNAIYQLTRKLKQINDGLRAYSQFT